MRLGRHADLMAVNRDAAAADERLFARSGEAPSPIYRFGYYPHNVHFLLVGAMNTGLAGDALDAAGKLDAVLSEEVMRRLAWTQAIKTAPYAAHATFSDAATVLALPEPPATLPLVVGYWRYTRGEALAREGRVAEAQAELAALIAHIGAADFSAMEAQFLPARDVLGVARHLLEARIAQARGAFAAAEQHLLSAIALQDGLPYMEPPYWHYPVRQTLAAVLLQQGRAGEAAAEFARTVDENPRNGWALWGLAEARTAAGDAAGAAAAREAFDKAWLGDPALLTLLRL
jgi:tetratricopeptide (TPR) repeat protein